MTASRIPPLVLNASGSIADQIVDRLTLHLRAQFPETLGGKTLDEIALLFSNLRDEIVRLTDMQCEQGE